MRDKIGKYIFSSYFFLSPIDNHGAEAAYSPTVFSGEETMAGWRGNEHGAVGAVFDSGNGVRVARLRGEDITHI